MNLHKDYLKFHFKCLKILGELENVKKNREYNRKTLNEAKEIVRGYKDSINFDSYEIDSPSEKKEKIINFNFYSKLKLSGDFNENEDYYDSVRYVVKSSKIEDELKSSFSAIEKILSNVDFSKNGLDKTWSFFERLYNKSFELISKNNGAVKGKYGFRLP